MANWYEHNQKLVKTAQLLQYNSILKEAGFEKEALSIQEIWDWIKSLFRNGWYDLKILWNKLFGPAVPPTPKSFQHFAPESGVAPETLSDVYTPPIETGRAGIMSPNARAMANQSWRSEVGENVDTSYFDAMKQMAQQLLEQQNQPKQKNVLFDAINSANNNMA